MSSRRHPSHRAARAFILLASLLLLLAAPFAHARTTSRAQAMAQRNADAPTLAAHASAALTPERRRLSDEAIAHDLALFDGWQRTLDSLASADPRPSVYQLARAQGILNLARQQYERGDRCGAVEIAFDEAAALIQRILAGQENLPVGAPPILHAGTFRPDLWARAIELRAHAGYRCIEAQVARSEIMLLQAAHETYEGQSCDSVRIVGDAQALLDEALATADACVARDAAPPMVPAINPRSPERRAVLMREIELLPKYVRFEIDSSAVDPASALILDLIADKLTKYSDIRVRLSGHAVSRASLAYNLLLSKQRTESVRDYFQKAGIAEDRMDLEYYATPMSEAQGEKIDAVARDHCVLFEYMVPGMDILPNPPDDAPKPEKPAAPKKKSRR